MRAELLMLFIIRGVYAALQRRYGVMASDIRVVDDGYARERGRARSSDESIKSEVRWRR